MMATGESSHFIRSAREARAIASPVRQEIVDVLEGAGACTIAEIAAHLERAPDGLYFHVRELERVGLLVRQGERGEGRSKAAVYDLPGRPMRMDYSGGARVREARLGPTVDGILRLARRDARRALREGTARAEGSARDLWVARARGRVSESDLVRINALLEECAQIVRTSRGGESATPVALAYALTPVRGARRSRSLARERSSE